MGALTYTQVGELIKQAGGTAPEQTIGAGIALGVESGGTPTVYNSGPGSAAGLFQFEPTTWKEYAPSGAPGTAAQATPLQQAQAFVADVNHNQGYRSWAPDLLHGQTATWGQDPVAPLLTSPVGKYLVSMKRPPASATPTLVSTPRAQRPGAGGGTATTTGWLQTLGGWLTAPFNAGYKAGQSTATKTKSAVGGALFGPIISWVDNKAVRVGLVLGGAILVVVGIVLLVHGVQGHEDAAHPEEAQERHTAEHTAEAGAVAA